MCVMLISERSRAGFAGHTVVALALAACSVVSLAVGGAQSLPALALATVALGILLAGRRDFQREVEPRGVSIAVLAFVVALPVCVVTVLAWCVPLVVLLIF